MLQLRVHGAAATVADVAGHLRRMPGARHVITVSDSDSAAACVTADLVDDAVDGALRAVDRLGISDSDVVLVRLDSVGPAAAQRPLASVVWADLISQAGANARPFPRYLAFMVCAGVVAAFGVIYASDTLIVGAMAISPDTLPITAAATAVVLMRWRLAMRAVTALIIGLAIVGVVAVLLTFVLRHLDLLPTAFQTGRRSFLRSLSSVNVSTPLVALAAGVAAMLALETRASAAVGVAISVTTIPASAYLGVAVGLGAVNRAAGALAVLGINVAMLLVGATTTLLLQRRVATRRGAGEEPAPG